MPAELKAGAVRCISPSQNHGPARFPFVPECMTIRHPLVETRSLKQVIFKADDFGLSPAVNAGIELAHREGVLDAASLMVGAAAAAEAVVCAKRNPGLKVGLHLVVVANRAVLPPAAIPDLVDASGELSRDFARAGFRYFFLPRVRRQLAAEIRAQFEAFKATGLPLDHVDAHHHLHLHPTVFGLLLQIGRDYGVKAVRLPAEPALLSQLPGEGGGLARQLVGALLKPWITLVKWRLRRAGIATTDRVIGLHDTGRMSATRLRHILRTLPVGTSEIFFHPAVSDAPGPWPLAVAASRTELDALLDGEVRQILEASGIRRGGFCDLQT